MTAGRDTARTLQCAERVAKDYDAFDDNIENDGNAVMRRDAGSKTTSHALAPAAGCHFLSINDPVKDDTRSQSWSSSGGSPLSKLDGRGGMGGGWFLNMPPPHATREAVRHRYMLLLSLLVACTLDVTQY
jgi:hypothetical protein